MHLPIDPSGELRMGCLKIALLLVAMMIVQFAAGQDCDANKLCANNMCCSQWGYCGCTSEYCGSGCKSQCNGCGGGGGGGAGDGEATYYSPYVPSACYGYDTSKFPSGNMIAAASRDLYNGGALCGAYYEITCKGSVASGKGCKSNPTVKVRVVDLCPGCKASSFDLSYEAFSKIADPDVGRIKISSRKVSGVAEGEEQETEMIAQVV